MTSGLFDLSGEVAVVIGATGVLGGALAEGLALAGAKVAILGRNAPRGEARVAAIREHGKQASFFSADATDKESLRSAHLALSDAFGAPTILVNAAGGNDPKVTVSAERSFEQITLSDWHANFDLNLVGGVLLPCQEFGPAMVAARTRQHHQHRQCLRVICLSRAWSPIPRPKRPCSISRSSSLANGPPKASA